MARFTAGFRDDDNGVNVGLRARAAAREAILVPGAADALTARLIAAAGFEAVYVSGAGVANKRLGVPDIGLAGLSDMADTVARIRDVVDLPLIADADTGFGNAVNVHHTVRVLERAGADAIQIEDQVFPKRCGHFAGKHVIPLEDAVTKIAAAADARRDEGLLIIARTDARAVEGLAAAIDRAAAFIAAGADLTFVEAPTSVDELSAIAVELPVPQVANMVHGGKTPVLDQARLAQMGFGMVLYANAALQASIRAMTTVLSSLAATGSLKEAAPLLADFEERQAAVDYSGYQALEARFREV